MILLMKMQLFFGSTWLLHCSWFFFSCKSFLRGVNKFFYIHGSFLLSPTLPEVWNFHARPEECVHYMFSFSLFHWFHKLWRVLCLHIVLRLGWTLTSKNAIWLYYQLQLIVEEIHPLFVEAAAPNAHLYKHLLTVLT